MVMTRKLAAVAGLVAGVAVIGAGWAQPSGKPAAVKPAPPPEAMKPPIPKPQGPVDYAAIADKVVGTSANVKEGEIVQILGGPGDLPLLEEIVVAVRKRGAFPLLQINSESIAKKVVATVPEKYDTQAPKLALELSKLVNVRIAIPAVRDPAIFYSISPERQVKIAKAEQPAEELARKRNVRLVELGNGFAPSPARAKDLGISEGELTRMFWDGIGADYATVQGTCEALKTTLARGKELKITHPNGTNLTIKLKGNKVTTNDGVITDAEIKAGGPGVNVWLPAGEAYVVPASADGVVTDDRLVFNGHVLEGVTISLQKGKTTSINAKSGWDGLKARYELAGPGKAELSTVDFGCNPAVKSSGKVESFVAAGTVTLFFGGNLWAGGTNKEPFNLELFLPGTSVTLDGKPLIENGSLQ